MILAAQDDTSQLPGLMAAVRPLLDRIDGDQQRLRIGHVDCISDLDAFELLGILNSQADHVAFRSFYRDRRHAGSIAMIVTEAVTC